jgi:sortase A
MSKRRNPKERSSFLINLVLLLTLLAGVILLAYPRVSDMWNRYENQQVIDGYQAQISDLGETKIQEMKTQAQAYNRNHKVNTIEDAFGSIYETEEDGSYEELLAVGNDGQMGSIEIPKLNLSLAIYHGLGEDVLERGVGHVPGTSLPIGGKGSHAVLAGHRGLPNASLFTDLDQLEVGDFFYVHVLDETLAYQVDQIKTVLPDQCQDLALVSGQDYLTLVTCTPYGINTHRLLVRGVRTVYGEDTADRAVQINPFFIAGGLVAVLCLLIFLIWRLPPRDSDKSKGGQERHLQEEEAELVDHRKRDEVK